MLQKIKTAMRISHNSLDDDILYNIDVCLADLNTAGVCIPDNYNNDALITKAIELYCKWQYDFMSKASQYYDAYEGLKVVLALTRREA